MKAKEATIEPNQLRDVVNRTPEVYPPELAFFRETPIQDTFIVRQMLASPVYATGKVSFLAFSLEKGAASSRFL